VSRDVLILSRTEDELAVPPVMAALTRRGARVWRAATDRMPHDGGVTWRGPGDGWIEVPGEGRLDLERIHSIWARRVAFGAGPHEDPALGRAIAGESRHVLLATLLDSPAFWVDPPAVYARARSKALQLRLAAEVGLDLPRTVHTNDPAIARAFVEDVGGPVVAKLATDVRIDGGTIYTNVLTPDDLGALDQLQGCPMILQEAVPKAAELRVVVCGDRVFAMRLDTASLPGADGDWRRVGQGTLEDWVPHRLDGATEGRFRALHERLHTNYGAADVVLTPDDRLVFLENNGVGESFWFYPHTDLADAWADLLLGDGPVRVAPRALA